MNIVMSHKRAIVEICYRYMQDVGLLLNMFISLCVCLHGRILPAHRNSVKTL